MPDMVDRTCHNCGQPFRMLACMTKFNSGKYCSYACFQSTRDKSTLAGFMRSVEKTDGCWLWAGSCNADGYGFLSVKDRRVSAHRLSWQLHFGPIEDGLFVCHHCDNPRCVRPDHLFLGTAKDNAADSAAKGRSARGERITISKLTETKVLEMRAKRAAGMVFSQIADEYGVSIQSARAAIIGKTWKHI